MTGLGQKHLFARIVLGGPPQLQYQFSERNSLGYLFQFSTATLYISTHCYVECLQLIDRALFTEFWILRDPSLPLCLPHLRKLKALIIYGLYHWEDVSEDVYSVIQSLIQQLQSFISTFNYFNSRSFLIQRHKVVTSNICHFAPS